MTVNKYSLSNLSKTSLSLEPMPKLKSLPGAMQRTLHQLLCSDLALRVAGFIFAHYFKVTEKFRQLSFDWRGIGHFLKTFASILQYL